MRTIDDSGVTGIDQAGRKNQIVIEAGGEIYQLDIVDIEKTIAKTARYAIGNIERVEAAAAIKGTGSLGGDIEGVVAREAIHPGIGGGVADIECVVAAEEQAVESCLIVVGDSVES